MGTLWDFISKPRNRTVISWIGAGIIAAVTALKVVVPLIWPDHSSGTACAQDGGIAANGNVTNNKIIVNGATPVGGTTVCGNTISK